MDKQTSAISINFLHQFDQKLKDICSLFAIPKSALGDMALSKYKKKDIPKLAKLMAAYIKR